MSGDDRKRSPKKDNVEESGKTEDPLTNYLNMTREQKYSADFGGNLATHSQN